MLMLRRWRRRRRRGIGAEYIREPAAAAIETRLWHGREAPFDPAAPAPLCPWPLNFLATPTLCVLVPRRAAEAHGVNMISLAFAGLFLPRGGSLAAALKAAGTEDPLALLEMVAGTAPQRG
jgi:hypothetical protein